MATGEPDRVQAEGALAAPLAPLAFEAGEVVGQGRDGGEVAKRSLERYARHGSRVSHRTERKAASVLREPPIVGSLRIAFVAALLAAPEYM
jgi:hypothetical protein